MKRLRDRQLRASRGFLIATGIVLLGAAVIAALLAAKIVDDLGGPLDSHTALLNSTGMRLLRRHQLAFQSGAALISIVVIATGITWLRQQIPPMRHQHDTSLDIADPHTDGHNVIAGDALAQALEHDLVQSPLVARARAEIQTRSQLIRLRLDIDEATPVDCVISTVVDPAVARIATVAELTAPLHIEADIRLVRHVASLH
jgi:hypothetical protein